MLRVRHVRVRSMGIMRMRPTATGMCMRSTGMGVGFVAVKMLLRLTVCMSTAGTGV